MGLSFEMLSNYVDFHQINNNFMLPTWVYQIFFAFDFYFEYVLYFQLN